MSHCSFDSVSLTVRRQTAFPYLNANRECGQSVILSTAFNQTHHLTFQFEDTIFNFNNPVAGEEKDEKHIWVPLPPLPY